MFFAGVVIDQEENGFSFAGAAADFHARGNAGEDGLDAGFFEKAGGEVVEECRVEPRADVGDAAFADLAGDDSGLIVEPAVTLSITFDDFGVRRLDAELLGPDVGGAGAEVAGEGDIGIEGVELIDTATQEGRQRSGLALGLEGVEFVLHGRAWTEEEMASVADPGHEAIGRGLGDDVEAGELDNLVAVDRRVDGDHVHGLGLLAEGTVEGEHFADGIEVGGVALEGDGPAAVVVVDEGDLGGGSGAGDGGSGFGE